MMNNAENITPEDGLPVKKKAGRPKGYGKTGGRQKGTKNEKNQIQNLMKGLCEDSFPRFVKELNSLKGKQYAEMYLRMVEKYAPKQIEGLFAGMEHMTLNINVAAPAPKQIEDHNPIINIDSIDVTDVEPKYKLNDDNDEQ